VFGWVIGVSVYIYDEGDLPVHVVRARVMHSQQMNATPLFPLIIIHEAGNVKSAPCNCKAGLGESCSCVASVLFYIEAALRLRSVHCHPNSCILDTSQFKDECGLCHAVRYEFYICSFDEEAFRQRNWFNCSFIWCLV